MNRPLISVCIPAYDRPKETLRLLRSVDSAYTDKIEIVICEDKSPEREKIAVVIKEFATDSKYNVRYVENAENLGYDRNLQELVRQASGDWIVLMGNDDAFAPGALDRLMDFLEKNINLGYVLRSYQLLYKNGTVEKFRYYEGNKFFEPGEATYLELFRKSVFISGFAIRRELALEHLVGDFDGTLLFQLYLAAEAALKYPTAYFDEVLTEQYERELNPSFGSSKTEKGLYTPGEVTVTNSLNFMKGFIKIATFLDKKYGFNSAQKMIRDISKYSYPVLSIQREKGLRVFWGYVRGLSGLGFNCTIYYYLYVSLLLIFGKKFCDWGIRTIKKILGKTPKL